MPTVGWIGVILGVSLGVAGAVFGTVMGLRSARSPRERSFLVKGALLTWALATGFVAALLLIETWHRHLLWPVYAIALIALVNFVNRKQELIRRAEAGGADALDQEAEPREPK